MPSIDSPDRLTFACLGLLVLVCLGSAFLMMPVLVIVPGRPTVVAPFLLTIVGCVLAQGCVLAAWLAWSNQPFWQRFRRHWIVASSLFLVWAAGLAVSRPSEFALVSAFVGLSVPLVSYAAQMPLWIARLLFGWRLIRGDANDGAGLPPLSIRDFMKATMLTALTLAIARLAPSPDGDEIGMLWVAMFIVASAFSAITLLPAGALMMRTQRFYKGILFASLYAAGWVGLLWLAVFIGRHLGLSPLPPRPILIGVSGLIVSFATTVMLAAGVARGLGYRLAWNKIARSTSHG